MLIWFGSCTILNLSHRPLSHRALEPSSWFIFMVFTVLGWVLYESRVVFHGTRWVFRSFLTIPGWFFMIPGGFSWLFAVPGKFLMIPGGFSGFFTVPGQFFHKSRWVFVLWFFMVPGCSISKLSAGGAKWDVENTPKGIRLICILAPRSRPLGPCRP